MSDAPSPSMLPVHIELLVQVGEPTVAPDGSAAVVSATHPDLGADATVGQLWRIPLADGEPRRITRGFRDTAPRFSPDGRRIAFLRGGRTDPAQLVVMPSEGGEPQVLTDRELGVSAFAWSPDGARIAFISRDPEPGRYGTVEGLPAGAEPPRRFTTSKYRANGVGVTIDRPARLFVLDVPAEGGEPVYEQAPRLDAPEAPARVPEARRLTDGDADLAAPAFSADGRFVLVRGALHGTRDADLVDDVYAVPVEGGAPVRRTDGTRSVDAFAVDGDVLWVVATELGPSRKDFVGRGAALWRIEGEEVVRLTDPAVMDLGDAPPPTPVDAGVLVVERRRGAADLLRIALDGSVERLSEGVEVTGHAAAGGRIVAAVQSPESFGELAVVGPGGLRIRTRFGDPLRAIGVARPRELVVTARDGSAVHGWVTVPDGDGPHPVLLMIHGGPFAQYGVHLFDETQVAAAAGYAVVQCNPRGSAGYGEEHARAIRHRMGTVDAADVLDFLDGAIREVPGLDGGRVGVLGGSYGGYLTAWTVAHDHRFAAAIVERGYLDPVGFTGTSDIGSFFSDEYLGTDPEQVAAQSPQAVVGAVRTPVLVIHSEDDLRCPISQGENYRAALHRQGVETELLVFPGEDHELSRSGRPRHRVERFDAVLDWWARHLPVVPR